MDEKFLDSVLDDVFNFDISVAGMHSSGADDMEKHYPASSVGDILVSAAVTVCLSTLA